MVGLYHRGRVDRVEWLYHGLGTDGVVFLNHRGRDEGLVRLVIGDHRMVRMRQLNMVKMINLVVPGVIQNFLMVMLFMVLDRRVLLRSHQGWCRVLDQPWVKRELHLWGMLVKGLVLNDAIGPLLNPHWTSGQRDWLWLQCQVTLWYGNITL